VHFNEPAQPIDKEINLLKTQHKLKPTMTKFFLLGLALVLTLSCTKDNDDNPIKQENGIVWLSGGLAFCAEQIHLDNGDVLIVNLENKISFKSGDRVNVKFKEIGLNESCTPGIDCEIIEIKKAE